MSKPFRHEEEVVKQLTAIDTSHFDIRIVNPQGKVVDTRDELFPAQIKDILDWLYEKNEKGNRIEIRPSGDHGIALISGLSQQQVQGAKLAGFEAAVAVEYAKDRFQIWLKFDRKLSDEEGEQASQKICQQIGGDCEASHWDSYGYLAGFTANSFQVRLVAHGGEVFSAASQV